MTERSFLGPVAPAFLVLAALANAGCAGHNDDDEGTSESRLEASNCSFIPGCTELLEAKDGPFVASLTTSNDGTGGDSEHLFVSYSQGSLDVCSFPQHARNVTLVLVTGPHDARVAVRRSMEIACATDWGDNVVSSNRATWSLARGDDPELWDTLFPPNAQGKRWYALRVAATNANGDWDSRFGEDFRLVLKRR